MWICTHGGDNRPDGETPHMLKLKRSSAFYKDIYFHIFPIFSSLIKKEVLFKKKKILKLVLPNAVYPGALPKTKLGRKHLVVQ